MQYGIAEAFHVIAPAQREALEGFDWSIEGCALEAIPFSWQMLAVFIIFHDKSEIY